MSEIEPKLQLDQAVKIQSGRVKLDGELKSNESYRLREPAPMLNDVRG